MQAVERRRQNCILRFEMTQPINAETSHDLKSTGTEIYSKKLRQDPLEDYNGNPSLVISLEQLVGHHSPDILMVTQ